MSISIFFKQDLSSLGDKDTYLDLSVSVIPTDKVIHQSIKEFKK
jgi:hypothetical protein